MRALTPWPGWNQGVFEMAKAKLKEEVTVAAEIIQRDTGEVSAAEPSLIRLAMQG